jgi:hypothetical protein
MWKNICLKGEYLFDIKLIKFSVTVVFVEHEHPKNSLWLPEKQKRKIGDIIDYHPTNYNTLLKSLD